MKENFRTKRGTTQADRAVSGDEPRHTAASSGVLAQPQFLAVPDTMPQPYKLGGYGKWQPTNASDPGQPRGSGRQGSSNQAYGGNGQNRSYGKSQSNGRQSYGNVQSQGPQSYSNTQSRGQAYGGNGQIYRGARDGKLGDGKSYGGNGQSNGIFYGGNGQGAESRNPGFRDRVRRGEMRIIRESPTENKENSIPGVKSKA